MLYNHVYDNNNIINFDINAINAKQLSIKFLIISSPRKKIKIITLKDFKQLNRYF